MCPSKQIGGSKCYKKKKILCNFFLIIPRTRYLFCIFLVLIQSNGNCIGIFPSRPLTGRYAQCFEWATRHVLSGQCAVHYSFSRLLKHDFDCFVWFFNTPHTISTTTHPISKTPQIHCKMKHSCKNYTLIYQNHILLPYETHTLNITEFVLDQLHTAVANLKHF